MHPDITSGHSPYRTWAEAKFFLVLAFALGLQHWNNPHRWALLRPILADGGSPPLGGNRCFTVGYLGSGASTTDLTLRPPLFTLRPPLSHTPLSHTTLTHTALTLGPLLSHYDHPHRCLREKWHQGSASSTSPRSPEPESDQSQGAPW